MSHVEKLYGTLSASETALFQQLSTPSRRGGVGDSRGCYLAVGSIHLMPRSTTPTPLQWMLYENFIICIDDILKV